MEWQLLLILNVNTRVDESWINLSKVGNVKFCREGDVFIKMDAVRPSTACDEAHEPAAAGLPRSGLLQGEDVEPQQLGQTLPADAGVQFHPGPADQQHPHQALRQLPWTGTHYS